MVEFNKNWRVFQMDENERKEIAKKYSEMNETARIVYVNSDLKIGCNWYEDEDDYGYIYYLEGIEGFEFFEDLEKFIIETTDTMYWKEMIYNSLREYVFDKINDKYIDISKLLLKVNYSIPYNLKEYRDCNTGEYFDIQEIENSVTAEIIYNIHCPWNEIE